MSNLGLDRGPVCRVPPHGYALGTLVASPEALPAIIRYTPLPAAVERILDADRALMVRAGLRLDMQSSSQERRRNSAPEGWRNSAPPPPKPRGGRSALAG